MTGKKNITVDEDLVEKINEVADKLSGQLGFRPTLSQTIRHLIHAAGLDNTPHARKSRA